ncbi:phosphoenolpyruvate phosphomutase-like isoform X1 [Schistocerca piceifrons]|uniref:phosphoenolpyruvate phosphomutase-like isoform X1 n=1 Tax=Schistocerca piceifrons TaxID=274613 RepID=UPI001F5FBBAD|nr:phosphoenolpyruvate phosphomutase-like isoform X1 [Schistocerca piceifrons]XP_047116734.1 phosphoenolpyruvate phosphomutase-like isoform X1 [Schistocerca piceifrons]
MTSRAMQFTTLHFKSLANMQKIIIREASAATTSRKSTQLKTLLQSSELSFLMEAHSGLSARIVEETGFSGIWGSGLSISAQLGVRDSNEASWTQILDVVEFMADATSIPILLDADTGYGNFNNARRLVRKLEERGIAGCCIEDKCFPKTNSLLDGRQQPLADVEEFALKIKACKDHQKDPDFCVVARVEAFIAGWGLDEALQRAEAYKEAGADAILIHSKKTDPSDIEAFMKKWQNKGPVVIVPTKYYTTPTKKFEEMGISTVIWANHNLRASVQAMQSTSKQIFEEKSLAGVEKKIVPVKEVFRLQHDSELKAAEDRYLPKK